MWVTNIVKFCVHNYCIIVRAQFIDRVDACMLVPLLYLLRWKEVCIFLRNTLRFSVLVSFGIFSFEDTLLLTCN